jgi:hypothetical protein
MDLCWIFDSHKNWTSLYPVWTHSELDCYMLPSPSGPSKRYINLVTWYIPRVNSVCAWVSTSCFPPLLPSLPSSLQHLLASLATLCHWKYPSGSSSCQVQLQLYFRLHILLSSTNLQVQLLAVLQGFSCFNCLLTVFKIQLIAIIQDFSGCNFFLLFSS